MHAQGRVRHAVELRLGEAVTEPAQQGPRTARQRQLDDVLVLDIPDQVCTSIPPGQPGVDDQGDPIAEPFGFFNVVGSGEDGCPGLVQRGKPLPDLPGATR